MKKLISLIVLLLLIVNVVGVKGTVFSGYLPGGKNYLDEDNFSIVGNNLTSLDNIKVKSNTYYTISLPGSDLLYTGISIVIRGKIDYFDGDIYNESDCVLTDRETICIFETTLDEEYLSISIEAARLGEYLSYYGFNEIQLEEGPSASDFEEYVIPLVDILGPEFLGIGGYIKSYDTFESIESIIANHITVLDEVDGDLSNNIIIESDSYTGYEQIVGEYTIDLSASDSSGNTAYFSLNIIVKDEILPNISGPTEIMVNINSDDDINSLIINNFIINDDYGGVLINILEDNYTVDKDSLGTYFVRIEVVDDYGNSSDFEFNILVVDLEAPVIQELTNFDLYLDKPFNIEAIMETLIINDNYDVRSDLRITILTDGFTGYENEPGSYAINYEVSDLSLNKSTGFLTVNVIDNISPEISGPVTYQGSYEEELTVDDFLSYLSVSDNITELLLTDMYIIEDTYSSRSSITGDFVITFGIKDEFNNLKTHTIEISIFDDIAPVIYIDNYIVTVDVDSTFSMEDALTLMTNSNELLEGDYSIETLEDEYSGNESIEGTYLYRMKFTNENGESYEKEFLVNVINSGITKVDTGLLIRNIVMYSVSTLVFVLVIIKNKK